MSEETQPVQDNTDATETPTETDDVLDSAYEDLQSEAFGEDLSDSALEEDEPIPDAEEDEPEPEEEATETNEVATEPIENKEVAEEVTEEVKEVDEYAALREAGYKAENISALVGIIQENPKVQAALKEAIEGPSAVVEEPPKEEEKEKTLRDFMPEGKAYSSIDAMEESSDSFKAYSKYTQWLASQEIDRRSAEQAKAQQQEVLKQRQIGLLQDGAKELKEKYNVTEEEIEKFGQDLKTKTNVSPLKVAYLGMNFEKLVAAKVEEAVALEADKRAEAIIRTKHNGKIKSSTAAETGLAKKITSDPFSDIDAAEKQIFGE